MLSEDAIEQLNLAYSSATSLDRYYAIRGASIEASADIATIVEAMLPALRAPDGSGPDTILTMEEGVRGVFFDTQEVTLDWHADFLEAYVLQGADRFFTLWFPIVKAEPGRSGIDLIPLDRLQAEAPDVATALLGTGASRVAGEFLVFEEGGNQKRIPFPVDPTTFAEQTHTMPGDVVVFRGDVLHRSQEVGDQRISYVVRACDSGAVLRRQEMLKGSIHKHQRMLREPEIFCRLLTAFHILGKSAVTYSEARMVAERISNRERYPRLVCRWYFFVFPFLIARSRLQQNRDRSRALRGTSADEMEGGSSRPERQSPLTAGLFGLRLARSWGLNLAKYVIGNRFS